MDMERIQQTPRFELTQFGLDQFPIQSRGDLILLNTCFRLRICRIITSGNGKIQTYQALQWSMSLSPNKLRSNTTRQGGPEEFPLIGSTRLKTNLGRCEKISTSAVCPFCVTWAPNKAPLPMRWPSNRHVMDIISGPKSRRCHMWPIYGRGWGVGHDGVRGKPCGVAGSPPWWSATSWSLIGICCQRSKQKYIN